MKKIFLFLTAVLMTIGVMAETKISPTVCGLTVGKTTTKDKTAAQWNDIIQSEGKWELISFSQTEYIYYGDFLVKGLKDVVYDEGGNARTGSRQAHKLVDVFAQNTVYYLYNTDIT